MLWVVRGAAATATATAAVVGGVVTAIVVVGSVVTAIVVVGSVGTAAATAAKKSPTARAWRLRRAAKLAADIRAGSH